MSTSNSILVFTVVLALSVLALIAYLKYNNVNVKVSAGITGLTIN